MPVSQALGKREHEPMTNKVLSAAGPGSRRLQHPSLNWQVRPARCDVGAALPQ